MHDVRGNDAGGGRAHENLLEGTDASANGSLGQCMRNNTVLLRSHSVEGGNPATFLRYVVSTPPPPHVNIDVAHGFGSDMLNRRKSCNTSHDEQLVWAASSPILRFGGGGWFAEVFKKVAGFPPPTVRDLHSHPLPSYYSSYHPRKQGPCACIQFLHVEASALRKA